MFGKTQHTRIISLLLLHESLVIKSFTHKNLCYVNIKHQLILITFVY